MADEILATAPVLRFAPSPNGALHLGHAYSALMNDRIAVETNGRVLLRIEDLDRTRCKPQFEAAIVDDLAWLGLRFPAPRRQSEHGDDYAAALARLDQRGLVYPCFCSRSEIARASHGQRDPDGAPLYPGTCRVSLQAEVRELVWRAATSAAFRLDMRRALDASTGVSLLDRIWRGRRSLAASRVAGGLGRHYPYAAAIWRRAIIWRWWSTTRCRA